MTQIPIPIEFAKRFVISCLPAPRGTLSDIEYKTDLPASSMDTVFGAQLVGLVEPKRRIQRDEEDDVVKVIIGGSRERPR